MSKQKQSILKSFAWPVAVAIAAAVVGIFNHASGAAYFTGGFIWAVGVITLAVNYSKDLEESMYPYYLQTVGALVTMTWACVG